ncbi:MAG TPA: hypothetical protein VM915_13100 [Verrucomicrobiae bacterium]|nr:hypothetical protein [Verrucomicrobiae bacterium]
MSVRTKRRALRWAMNVFFVGVIAAALGQFGYLALAGVVAFYICFVTYSHMACPECRSSIIDNRGFLPPRNAMVDLRNCPHCDADFEKSARVAAESNLR